MRFGAALSRTLDQSGAFDAVLRLRSWLGSSALPVLCYHSVRTLPDDYPFDGDVVDTTPEEFDRHIALLQRYYKLIGVDELADELAHGRSPRGCALISFDDGYRDNYSQALPILRAHGAVATFFLATSYMSERKIFWWERISYLFTRTKLKSARLSYPTELELDLEHRRGLSKRLVLSLIKTVHGLDLNRLLAHLTEALQVRWDEQIEARFAEELVLTWDEAREMKRQGMSFGSHTSSHRILTTLPIREVRAELSTSKRVLEQELGGTIHSVSYPVGMPVRLVRPIISAVEEAGYTLGFTNLSGVASVERLDPFDISRVSMDRDVKTSALRGMLAFPPLCTVVRPWISN